jgi:DNA replicative helicase MCM subunit Mcm2 (Cdc46/Mcm family)
MSAPIISRFDLLFVALDECDEETDLNIARHIINVHWFQDEAINRELSMDFSFSVKVTFFVIALSSTSITYVNIHHYHDAAITLGLKTTRRIPPCPTFFLSQVC